jgi:molecular chaperone GrpE
MSQDNTKNWKEIKENYEREHELIDEEDLVSVNKEEDDTDTTALDHPSYLALEKKLMLAEQQSTQNFEKSLRAIAELENVRRRTDREVANAHRYGLEKIIAALLPVVDSLEQALQLAKKEAQTAMAEGLELTMKLFLDVLTKQSVQQLDPLGESFNPQEHEAMAMQEVDDAQPNSVIAVFQKGYKLNDRVVRPARVIVAKAKAIDEKA